MGNHYDYGGGGIGESRVEKYKRYVTMGLRDGKLIRIIARRGHTPDDIIRQTLENRREETFARLYLMTVGDEGVYGQRTNLRLQEIVSPAPEPSYALVDVEAIF